MTHLNKIKQSGGNSRGLSRTLAVLSCWVPFFTGCGGSTASFQSVSQAQVEVDFGTGTTSAANTALSTTAMTLTPTCNGVSFPNVIVKGGSTLPLLTGASCTLTLVSFTTPASGETFTSASPANVGSTTNGSGSYTGTLGNTAVITPSVTVGSLSSIAAQTTVLFTYQSANTVVAGFESNYSYLGVVNGKSGTMQLTFSTATGSATSLALSTSSLPATWSASTSSCSSVTTSSNCLITLTFTPVSVNASQQTLTLPYTYVTDDGVSHSSAVTLGYQGLNRLKWSYTTGSNIDSRPLLSTDGSSLYVTGMDGKLYSFNANTGAVNWTYTASNQMQSSPIYNKDKTALLVGAVDGKTASVSPSTGSQNWLSASCGSSFYGELGLSIDGTTLFAVGYSASKIFTFAVSNGATGWSSPGAVVNGVSTVVLSPDGSYAYVPGGSSILQYSTSSHTQTGSYAVGSSTGILPRISADGTTLYTSGGPSTKQVFAINVIPASPPTLALKWSSVAAGGSIQAGVTLSPDELYAYALSTDGFAYKFATTQTNGATNVAWLWKSSTSLGGATLYAPPYTSPSGDVLYIQGGTSLYELSATDGSVNWSYTTGVQCPWYSNGGLLPNANGSVIYGACWADQKIYAFNESVIKH